MFSGREDLAGVKDQLYSKALEFSQTGWPEKGSPGLEAYSKRKLELMVEEECLLWCQRADIPEACRGKVLSELHGSNDGLACMKSLARLHAWCPNTDNEIVKTLGEYSFCQKFRNRPVQEFFHRPNPEQPWGRLYIEFGGQFL